MISKKLMTKKFLIAPVAGAILSAGILIGCTIDNGSDGREGSSEGVSISRDIGGESKGEHSGGGESRNEGAEGSGGSEEGNGAGMLAPNETFDMTRAGARLMLNYDSADNAFIGTVENTTNSMLTNVRIEVHLSNGAELGPTTPVDMAPGEVIAINLPSTPEAFTGWTPHTEVGSGEAGGESGGEQVGSESGPDGPEGPESGSEAAGEAAMSSPTTPLDQTWNGALGGLAISARYDAATQSVHTTVQNISSYTLCYVQSEPHLKSGMQTVGELGPGKMGDLNPGQQATSVLSVSAEPELAGVAYDGYVVHMEVFDCGGPGPVAHTGAEGGAGEGAGGEGHSPGGEGSVASGSEPGGGEHGSGGESRGEHGSGGERKGGG